MLFKTTILVFSLLGLTPEEEIVSRIPEDWYTSTTKLFEYCTDVNFQHPICPSITVPKNEQNLVIGVDKMKNVTMPVQIIESASDQMKALEPMPTASTAPLPDSTEAKLGETFVTHVSLPKKNAEAGAKAEDYSVSQSVDTKLIENAPSLPPTLKADLPEENSSQASMGKIKWNFESKAFAQPVGKPDSKNLFQATLLYQVGKPPVFYLHDLKLDQKKPPKGVAERLWAEFQWLWAKVLFDQKNYKESAKIFDLIVRDFKGRGLFHQQRAWAQFFTGRFDQALGSIVSAESPLIYQVPYFEKYFLRALIERETCHWTEAFNTLSKGRAALKFAKPKPEIHPWVVLCERKGLKGTCANLKEWYSKYYQAQITQGLDDLDLLEIELRDRGAAKQRKKKATSPIVWKHVGENWGDELGLHSIPIENLCI